MIFPILNNNINSLCPRRRLILKSRHAGHCKPEHLCVVPLPFLVDPDVVLTTIPESRLAATAKFLQNQATELCCLSSPGKLQIFLVNLFPDDQHTTTNPSKHLGPQIHPD